MSKKAFVLDFNLLEKEELTINQFLTLLNIKYSEVPYKRTSLDSDILQNKGYIKIITEDGKFEIIIREKGNILLDTVTIEGLSSIKNKKIIKKSSRVIDNEIQNFIEEYRSLWKGYKPGSMGSLQSCIDKMTDWMKQNPKYSMNDILKAARIYLQTITDPKYLQQADYFIYKDGVSRLSSFIDEVEVKDDWTTKLN